MRFLFALSIWPLVHRVGGFAFILLGLLDNSVIPLPGSMDVLLIALAASKREWWWYYALWATAGSVIGGYVNYRIFRKGGKEALEKKLGKRAKKVYAIFDKYGFATIVVGAMAPPPVPIVAFIGTAGALQYSRHKFLAALTLGRAVRFAFVGWVASHYGRGIFQFFSKYYKPAFWTLIGLAVVGGIAALIYYLNWRRKHPGGAAGRVHARPAA